jgi:DNA polymerase I-like protein with 3'-5' exonuclease and polymerase domains
LDSNEEATGGSAVRAVWDIEANDLLNHNTIDYTASPYRLLPTFEMHCIVVKDIDSKQKFKFVQKEVKDFPDLIPEFDAIIAHNQISYDLLAAKLYLGIDYEIRDDFRECTINGRKIEIVDTLVLSKTLNPDRYGGHSIDDWGQRLGLEKIDWRAKAIELGLISHGDPRGAEFKVYHPEMLVYCERDVDVTEKVYFALMAEWGKWPWSGPFSLEQQTRDIVTRQEHRGFFFNKALAESNVRELDQKMEEIKAIVEPILPPKLLGVTKLKQYLPPKIQFKKNGEISAVMEKWVAKHGGEKVTVNGEDALKLYDKVWMLPMDPEIPVQTHEPATVKDTTHIKGYLVELGWKPTQYKERDLTCDSKKNKLSPEKFQAAVERYVEQTLESPFCSDRCAELDTTPKLLLAKLLRHDLKRPLKVYTNPTITVGMEKEIDPALLELADQFPHAKLVSEYLTYSHRRNSILGGGQEVFDDDERDDDDEYAGKGFLAAERISCDGRIPTPADTCGAGTSRFKHKLVANIPRVTSLYGKNMRALFGVDTEDGKLQLGYDFDSLEAKIEAHYVFKYDGGPEYGVSLTAEKPNDCHSVLAREITEILRKWSGNPERKAFPRSTSKNVKYGCSYNAQPARVAKTVGCSLDEAQIIFDAFWTQAAPLKELKENMQKYWETTGEKKFLKGLDGRKLPIRSKGNVINTAFQSAGVICAKRAMVLHEKYLKEEGLYIDFFRDDWKNKSFCQQLIAYHDEAQLEICRDQVKWKKFDSEEECKAFKDPSGKVWSDPVHNDKGWFRGYVRAGELATIAVREAGKFYKLNVELSAGYMLGTDWASCH